MREVTALNPTTQRVKSLMKAERLQKKLIKQDEDGIVWTTRQKLLILSLANGILTTKRTNDKPSSIIYNHAEPLGIRRLHAFALSHFKPFWEAVNEEVKLILGYKEFGAVARRIYESALVGDHQDRRLYLEVFTDFKKKSETISESFEEQILRIELNVHNKESYAPQASIIDVKPRNVRKLLNG